MSEGLPSYLRRGRWVSRTWLALGFAFLYLPIAMLVVFAFNASPLPSVWGGFTLSWFSKLADDTEILQGLWLSLRIAFFTACGGAFGIEPLVGSVGPGIAVALICATPLLWSLPIALMAAETCPGLSEQLRSVLLLAFQQHEKFR